MPLVLSPVRLFGGLVRGVVQREARALGLVPPGQPTLAREPHLHFKKPDLVLSLPQSTHGGFIADNQVGVRHEGPSRRESNTP